MSFLQRPMGVFRGWTHRYVYPGLPQPRTKLVIIASARSGSNLLVSLLASHPDIYQYGEVIGESYVRQLPVRRAIQHTGASVYFRNAFKKRFYKKVVGVKILYYQLKSKYGERWDLPGVTDILTTIRRDPEIKIIHLKRRNALKILVSNEIARLTGEYVVRGEKAVLPKPSISLTAEQCQCFFEDLERTKREFDDCFSSHDVFHLTYKDLVENQPDACRKMLSFLGVSQIPLKAGTARQSRRSLSEQLDNYDVLKSHFQHMPWADYFED